ncbi:hypothetical protein ACFFGV_09635 [Pontibacillus salicampi]|uniref:Uncharacterized protein n=1 Tax=Pontibacillus salicampi TaxID=1449801 RepID=A0ABV6LN50_9BACI
MKQALQDKIVEAVVAEIYAAYPQLQEAFGERGRRKTIEDNYHHLHHLETCFELRDYTFFQDYTAWLQRVLTSRGVSTELIIDNFERLSRHMEIETALSKEESTLYQHYLEQAISFLQHQGNSEPHS